MYTLLNNLGNLSLRVQSVSNLNVILPWTYFDEITKSEILPSAWPFQCFEADSTGSLKYFSPKNQGGIYKLYTTDAIKSVKWQGTCSVGAISWLALRIILGVYTFTFSVRVHYGSSSDACKLRHVYSAMDATLHN